MNDFAKAHFDKLLLSFLLLILFFGAIHVLHHGSDAAAVNWMENTVGQVLAALLTLMVGQRAMQRGSDTSGNGSNGANGHDLPSASPSLAQAATPTPAPAPPRAFGR